jgi:hypothetical protein
MSTHYTPEDPERVPAAPGRMETTAYQEVVPPMTIAPLVSAEAALSDRQLDGMACIKCGKDFEPGSRSVPAGCGDRGQLFLCADGWGCAAAQEVSDEPLLDAAIEAVGE